MCKVNNFSKTAQVSILAQQQAQQFVRSNCAQKQHSIAVHVAAQTSAFKSAFNKAVAQQAKFVAQLKRKNVCAMQQQFATLYKQYTK